MAWMRRFGRAFPIVHSHARNRAWNFHQSQEQEFHAMGFDQSAPSNFCVMPGKTNPWDVKEEGFEKALASFDDQEVAIEYARDLAKAKNGSTVTILDERDGKKRSD
jgi:hypothetical protein